MADKSFLESVSDGSLADSFADSLTSKKKSSIQGFLSQFADAQGRFVNAIDPLNSFDIMFKFFPRLTPASQKESALSGNWKSAANKLASYGVGKLQQATSNLVNNATGGLVASLMNLKNDSITKQHESYLNDSKKYSFANYLAIAELLTVEQHKTYSNSKIEVDWGSTGDWLGGTSAEADHMLELDLSYYVQEVTIPQVKMADGQKAITMTMGEFPTNGAYLLPDSNQLQIRVISTKLPLLETIFYPWMREITLPYWSYETQPYTTATITIDFSKHCDIQYVFCGCRPQQIESMQAKNEQLGENVTRNLTMVFDYMFIQSKSLSTMEDWKSKLLSTGKTMFNSAANMINL